MALVLLVVLAGFCEVITAPMQAHESVLHVTVVVPAVACPSADGLSF